MRTTMNGLSLNRQLGALEMEKREVNEAANEEAVELHFDRQQVLRKEAEEAVERAKKEAEEAAFWSDVAQVAQVAAVVGGVVAGAARAGAAWLWGWPLLAASELWPHRPSPVRTCSTRLE